MIEDKVQEMKAAKMAASKPEDFSIAYPEYYDILTKYSDSKMFRAESADRLNATLSLNVAGN